MKLLKPVVVALAAAVLLTGCLYMDVKTPYDTDLNKTVLGQKTGKAHSQSVLWLFAWGDAGTAAAAKAGNITTVNHMDHIELAPASGQGDIKQIALYGISVTWGDDSIGSAAREKGLTELYYADREILSVMFGIWKQETIHVYGR